LVNIEGEHFKPKEHYAVILSFGSNYLITSGERFIIRDETNRFTIGGGEFILPSTFRRSKLTADHIAKLKTFSNDAFYDQIQTALIFDNRIFVPLDSLSTMFNRSSEEIVSICKSQQGDLGVTVGREKNISLKSKIVHRENLILEVISDFHRKNQQMPGIEKKIAKENLRSGFASEDEIDTILGLLLAGGKIIDTGELLKLKDFKIEYKGEESEIKDKIIEAYSDVAANTPKPERLAEILKVDEQKIQRIFQGLYKSGEIIGLGGGMYVSRVAFEKMVNKALDFITKSGEITVAQFRDLIGTNRNMAVLVLEAMDNKGITIRKENSRILKKK